jgi:hypothetical protein
VLIRHINVFADHFHVLFEIFDEFLVFLIAPGRAQRVQLPAERR